MRQCISVSVFDFKIQRETNNKQFEKRLKFYWHLACAINIVSDPLRSVSLRCWRPSIRLSACRFVCSTLRLTGLVPCLSCYQLVHVHSLFPQFAISALPLVHKSIQSNFIAASQANWAAENQVIAAIRQSNWPFFWPCIAPSETIIIQFACTRFHIDADLSSAPPPTQVVIALAVPGSCIYTRPFEDLLVIPVCTGKPVAITMTIFWLITMLLFPPVIVLLIICPLPKREPSHLSWPFGVQCQAHGVKWSLKTCFHNWIFQLLSFEPIFAGLPIGGHTFDCAVDCRCFIIGPTNSLPC